MKIMLRIMIGRVKLSACRFRFADFAHDRVLEWNHIWSWRLTYFGWHHVCDSSNFVKKVDKIVCLWSHGWWRVVMTWHGRSQASPRPLLPRERPHQPPSLPWLRAALCSITQSIVEAWQYCTSYCTLHHTHLHCIIVSDTIITHFSDTVAFISRVMYRPRHITMMAHTVLCCFRPQVASNFVVTHN